MRGDYWIPEQENLITYWEDACLSFAMINKVNIILDSTNFNEKTISRFKKLINTNNMGCNSEDKYEIEFKLIDTPLEVCIERDSKRECPVGAKIITNFYNRYVKSK